MYRHTVICRMFDQGAFPKILHFYPHQIFYKTISLHYLK